MPGLDPSTLRRLNMSVVLRAIAEYDDAVTMAMLVDETGLSRRTVELILGELMALDWVIELTDAAERLDVGRPPRRFTFQPDRSLIAAVRIDTNAATAVISDIRGRFVGRASRGLADYFDPAGAVADAAAAVRAAVTDAGLPLARVKAVAIAGGGTIDEDGIVHRLIFAPRWTGFDLSGAMRRELGIPAFADNDANLAALAEHWRGAARDHDTFVWGGIGNRSGLGIVIRGSVLRGVEGAAGEIVEARDTNRVAFQEHPVGMLTSPIAGERAEASLVIERARDGEAAALFLVDEFVANLVSVFATLSWTVAPPLIVLGAGLEVGADVLIPRVLAGMRALDLPHIEVRATALGSDAALVGGVRFALDRMDAELFGPTILE